MYLNDLPNKTQKMFSDLTNDDEFQKIFAKDEILNELEAQGKEDTEEFQHRVDEVVVDYLISKNKIPECQREYWTEYLKYHIPDIQKKTKRMSRGEKCIFFICLGIICAHFTSSWLLMLAIGIGASILLEAIFPTEGN